MDRHLRRTRQILWTGTFAVLLTVMDRHLRRAASPYSFTVLQGTGTLAIDISCGLILLVKYYGHAAMDRHLRRPTGTLATWHLRGRTGTLATFAADIDTLAIYIPRGLILPVEDY